MKILIIPGDQNGRDYFDFQFASEGRGKYFTSIIVYPEEILKILKGETTVLNDWGNMCRIDYAGDLTIQKSIFASLKDGENYMIPAKHVMCDGYRMFARIYQMYDKIFEMGSYEVDTKSFRAPLSWEDKYLGWDDIYKHELIDESGRKKLIEVIGANGEVGKDHLNKLKEILTDKLNQGYNVVADWAKHSFYFDNRIFKLDKDGHYEVNEFGHPILLSGMNGGIIWHGKESGFSTHTQDMTYDEWVDVYQPKVNDINIPMSRSPEEYPYNGTLFETYGEEYEYIQLVAQHSPKNLWTLVEVDDKYYVMEGFHYVNRVGYFVTEIAFMPGETFNILID